MPLKFSIAVTMTPSNNHNFVNFWNSHVRLQRFIFETTSFKNMQKKEKFDCFQKFTLEYHHEDVFRRGSRAPLHLSAKETVAEEFGGRLYRWRRAAKAGD